MTRSRVQPAVLIFAWALCAAGPAAADAVLRLPQPRLQGDGSLDEVIAARRSAREFSASAVSLEQVGQLSWAA